MKPNKHGMCLEVTNLHLFQRRLIRIMKFKHLFQRTLTMETLNFNWRFLAPTNAYSIALERGR